MAAETDEAFGRAWAQTWAALGVMRAPDAGRLLRAYAEPQRHYHTAGHVLACLRELRAAEPALEAQRRGVLELALFFHDAVYDPRRTDNEEASARLAEEFLQGLLNAGEVERVAALVRATDHRRPPRDEEEALVVDADLAILGRPWEEFAGYEAAIREEYGHVAEEAFRAGRRKVLEHFLARDRIYTTGWFFKQYEAAARINLQESIARLKPATGE